MIKEYANWCGGIREVNLTPAVQQQEEIPNSISFNHGNGNITNVNFWVFQTLRRNVPFVTISNEDKEDKIRLIKILRALYGIGLKEGKDIAEWFMANVDRYAEGKL